MEQRRLRGLAKAALEEADDEVRKQFFDDIEELRVALGVVVGEPEGLVVVLCVRRLVRSHRE